MKAKKPMTISSTSVLLSNELFDFSNEIEISNPSYPSESYNVNYTYNTDDCIVIDTTQVAESTRRVFWWHLVQALYSGQHWTIENRQWAESKFKGNDSIETVLWAIEIISK